MDRTRRTLLERMLELTGTALVSHLLPDNDELDRLIRTLTKRSSVDEPTLTNLRRTTESYWDLRMHGHIPTPDLLDAAEAHLTIVSQLFQSSLTPTSRTLLSTIFSETALFLGKLCSTDLQMPQEALSFFKLALVAAQQTTNDILYASVLGRIGAFAATNGKSEDALACFHEAQRLIKQSQAFTLRAWLAAEEAEVQAELAGQHTSDPSNGCFTSLEWAETFAQRMHHDEVTFGVYFDLSRLPGYQGPCHMRLKRPEAALASLEQALHVLEPSSVLTRAVYLDIAEACIQARRIEQACHAIEQALDSMTQTQSSFQRLATLRQHLELWNMLPEVKHLDTRLHDENRSLRGKKERLL